MTFRCLNRSRPSPTFGTGYLLLYIKFQTYQLQPLQIMHSPKQSSKLYLRQKPFVHSHIFYTSSVIRTNYFVFDSIYITAFTVFWFYCVSACLVFLSWLKFYSQEHLKTPFLSVIQKPIYVHTISDRLFRLLISYARCHPYMCRRETFQGMWELILCVG
ncbi:hypothetical protein SS50377_21474 [Spironucleus salmonicida]|uniref:Transmembrane protein n=1 Tax=Spironucleus salmonicida TaxID=348837 RepID=V6M2B7_9EUKA|nr:hypothetical protein SS50377_21474 [Spironucleus salmonicida]|eukprot:EST47374.1 Hypothetical protein SS50377_12546 [Spironucleus salmonicida]